VTLGRAAFWIVVILILAYIFDISVLGFLDNVIHAIKQAHNSNATGTGG
jgi:hypothetical protein